MPRNVKTKYRFNVWDENNDFDEWWNTLPAARNAQRRARRAGYRGVTVWRYVDRLRADGTWSTDTDSGKRVR